MPHRRTTPETLDTSAWRSYNIKLQCHKCSPHIKDSNATTLKVCRNQTAKLRHEADCTIPVTLDTSAQRSYKGDAAPPQSQRRLKVWNAMVFKVCRSQPANHHALKATAQHQRRWILVHSEATTATPRPHKDNAHIKDSNTVMFEMFAASLPNFLP